MKQHDEKHAIGYEAKLNWLRAGVLGANDGIVSIAGLVVGVAGATNSTGAILTAGIAGIIAGAISMAAGEYISVSSQRDSEVALLAKEEGELANFPKEELEELIQLYQAKGLTRRTAQLVARELTTKDVFGAHAFAELGIDPNHLTNPWQAALASALAFLIGAVIPLIAIILPSPSIRIFVAFISVVFSLAITGFLSAKIGGAKIERAVIRVVVGGILAMAVSYGIGKLLNVTGV